MNEVYIYLFRAAHFRGRNVFISGTIGAVRDVHHTPARVYAFLARLDNHWHLGGRALRVATLDEDGRGGRIVVTAPLGLRRTARTAVTTAHEPHRLGGIAHVGRNTRAHVQWSIERTPRGARVALESTICSIGAIDRLSLVLGGRWWLRRAFRRTLDALANALDCHYPHALTSERNRAWIPRHRPIPAPAAAGGIRPRSLAAGAAGE
jgi:hypothetical protein